MTIDGAGANVGGEVGTSTGELVGGGDEIGACVGFGGTLGAYVGGFGGGEIGAYVEMGAFVEIGAYVEIGACVGLMGILFTCPDNKYDCQKALSSKPSAKSLF